MQTLRRAIQGQVRHLVGTGARQARAPASTGDAGLFGPDSACWRVHGDFTSMMAGGVSALLLQMLHPAALAGVFDHSNFRKDPFGRLARTAQFIAGTTYGPSAEALKLIARVRAIHDRVNGRTPDGAAYSANDPELLTWVHVAEVSSFLKAYLRYRDPSFPLADQHRYFAETATIAERLGASQVPRTPAEIERYLQGMRPRLRADRRTRDIVGALRAPTGQSLAMAPFGELIFQAAQDLLPDWAAQMHGFRRPGLRAPAIRLGVNGLGRTLRWALTDGVEARARRRVAQG